MIPTHCNSNGFKVKQFLYRIYQIKKVLDLDGEVDKEEIEMECYACEDREQFKEHIRDTWGKNIKFTKPRKPNIDDVYCVIIGEAWKETSQRYFTIIESECAYCRATIKTLPSNIYSLDNWDIKSKLNADFKNYDHGLHFCTYKCKYNFIEREKQDSADRTDGEGLFVTTQTFANKEIIGFIYRITKRSTGQFYVGQTRHLPIFRWGQHLSTSRFPFSDIEDYIFETIEIVHKGESLNEREKYHIQEEYKKAPELSLNISLVNEELLQIISMDFESDNNEMQEKSNSKAEKCSRCAADSKKVKEDTNAKTE